MKPATLVLLAVLMSGCLSTDDAEPEPGDGAGADVVDGQDGGDAEVEAVYCGVCLPTIDHGPELPRGCEWIACDGSYDFATIEEVGDGTCREQGPSMADDQWNIWPCVPETDCSTWSAPTVEGESCTPPEGTGTGL